jgi:hypothetical protein
MSTADEYDQFCRELASLAAKRLVGQTVKRAAIAAAFHEALLEICKTDAVEELRPAPAAMPSEVADILGWHADQGGKAIERFESQARQIDIEQYLFGLRDVARKDLP